jgi:hypothetical protein
MFDFFPVCSKCVVLNCLPVQLQKFVIQTIIVSKQLMSDGRHFGIPGIQTHVTIFVTSLLLCTFSQCVIPSVLMLIPSFEFSGSFS